MEEQGNGEGLGSSSPSSQVPSPVRLRFLIRRELLPQFGDQIVQQLGDALGAFFAFLNVV